MNQSLKHLFWLTTNLNIGVDWSFSVSMLVRALLSAQGISSRICLLSKIRLSLKIKPHLCMCQCCHLSGFLRLQTMIDIWLMTFRNVLWFASGSDYRVGLWSDEGWGQKREVFLCKQLSACMCSLEEWMSSSCSRLSPVSLHLGSCRQVFFTGSLMGIERIKPGPTDAKVHAIKYTPTHFVLFFVWPCNMTFKTFISVLGLSHTWGERLLWL